jgi:thioredoxin:protein disulfide reductase
MLRIFLLIIGSLFALAASAVEVSPLPAEKAFVFSAHMEKPQEIIAQWQIAPGYYLYRDKFKIISPAVAKLMAWPKAYHHAKHAVYKDLLRIAIPLKTKSQPDIELQIRYQGCSQGGYCYAPIEKTVRITFPFVKEGLNQAPLITIIGETENKTREAASIKSDLLTDQTAAKNYLSSHSLAMIWLCFLGLGLLLAFTPCSLPMVPILSSIIIGQNKPTTKKAFSLSLSYVLGVASTYALAGMMMAWLGSSVSAILQNAWIISAFSLFFVFLSIALLRGWNLQLPAQWQQRIITLQQHQKSGTYIGVFLMGGLSTLVVSPCVTAPLVGVLSYIADTGNIFLGGSALFALGLGTGIPLLVIGSSTGKFLPQTGPWMETIKKIFGLLLLGLAIWMLGRIVDPGVTLFLWAALSLATAIYCFFFTEQWSQRGRVSAYILGSLLAIYGFVLFVGVAMNHTSPFYPIEKIASQYHGDALIFVDVKDMDHLATLLKEAKAERKPVILDFYANWCESCRAVEENVLAKPEVQKALQHFVLLRANVSANNSFDNTLLKKYNVIAPPTFLFFNRDGHELPDWRIIGEVDHQIFLARASQVD